MECTEIPMLVIGISTVLPECTPTDVVAGYPAPARPIPDRNPIVGDVLWGRDDSQHSRSSSLGSFACAEPPVYPPDLAKRNRNHPTVSGQAPSATEIICSGTRSHSKLLILNEMGSDLWPDSAPCGDSWAKAPLFPYNWPVSSSFGTKNSGRFSLVLGRQVKGTYLDAILSFETIEAIPG